jgi:U3 small nucleolar RNA-associated protein 7
MITLNPDSVGALAMPADQASKEVRDIADEANGEKFEPKNKKRGRSSAQRRFLRKQLNVVDAKREALKAKLEKEKLQRQREREGQPEKPWTPFDRFQRSQN